MDDQALVRACLAGDPRGWEQLIARSAPTLASVIRQTLRHARATADPSTVDDRLAETFAELLRNDSRVLRSWSGRASLVGWLKVIAYRRCLKYLDRQRPAPSLDDSGLALAPVAEGPSPNEAAQSVESRALVRGALTELPARDRRLLQGHLVEGRSYAELSAELGVAEGSVGPLLSRAKKRLRALLERKGIP